MQFVNRLRINLACQLLMGDAAMRITDVCFSSGFNNISNFNRQFLAQKGMTPSRFRALLAENEAAAMAALERGEEGKGWEKVRHAGLTTKDARGPAGRAGGTRL